MTIIGIDRTAPRRTDGARLRRVCGIAALAVSGVLAGFIPGLAEAQAQAPAPAWPTRPIRFISPQPPGGASDTFARLIGQRVSVALGQPVVVENRAGAAGIIGSDVVAKAPPDGYTFLVTFASHNLLPFTSKSLPFDAVRDFTPIIPAALTPFCLAVNPGVPATTALELIDYVRRNPGKVAYGSPGAGTVSQLAGELINLSAGLDMTHVPYKGGAPGIADLVGGQLPVGIFTLSTVTPSARAGKLRVLGVVEQHRARSAPDIPTLAEAGVPGFPLPDSWIGFLGPAGLPEAITRRLNAEVTAAIHLREVADQLQAIGLEVSGGTPEQFRETILRNTEVYRRVVQAARIKAE
jgi:tripartite-type tricarboxylate transporter receptor subunit TctC